MSFLFKEVKYFMRCINLFKDFTMDKIPFDILYDSLTKQTARIFNLPTGLLKNRILKS